jgi:hypothetical protein
MGGVGKYRGDERAHREGAGHFRRMLAADQEDDVGPGASMHIRTP